MTSDETKGEVIWNGHDPRPTDELIAEALRIIPFEQDDGELDRVIVPTLQLRGTDEVATKADALCGSSDPNARWLGITILAQLGLPDDTYRDLALKVILRALNSEPDVDVLDAAVAACSHRVAPETAEHLLRLSTHASDNVRFSVACALPATEDPRAVPALIRLSTDADDDVRNWATFGLGTLLDEVDTPELREALVARLDDPHWETQGEAMVGLALRRDSRVFQSVLDELQSREVGTFAVKAAGYLADSRFVPLLEALQGWWDIPWAGLDDSLEACRSGVPRED